MIKKLTCLTVAIALVMAFSFVGFGQQAQAQDGVVGIVFSIGGLGDMSFNDLAYDGLSQAEEELGIDFTHIEPDDTADFDPALRGLAEMELDLVIGTGFLQEEEVNRVAEEFPHVNFAHIDPDDPFADRHENIRGLSFAEHEGSFLAGVLAALVTESNHVGYIGGIDSPLINRFEGGFVQGVEYVEEDLGKDIEMSRTYAGSFDDYTRGREIALGFIDDGADVIYHAAGGVGEGLFTAAAEEDIYAIGVDSNQNWIEPGNIIASKLKRVDVAVYETIEDVLASDFDGGYNQQFNLEMDGVGITPLEAEVDEAIRDDLSEEEIEAIEEMKAEVTAPHAEYVENVKQKIIDGEIEIEDWARQ